MRDDNREKRRREIERAAYDLLAEKGYAGASMLSIAKRAGASNETLYRWYGGKAELFRSLVETNAAEIATLLRESINRGADPIDTLERAGPVLLRLLVSEKAIALNRAAAADTSETGVLGRALAAAGRDTVLPLVAAVFQAAVAAGRLGADDPAEPAEAYLALLVGDLQVRRVIGVVPPLDETAIDLRAARALAFTQRLFPATGSAVP